MTSGKAQSPFRTDPDLRTSLRLPARPLLKAEKSVDTLKVQVRMTAVSAAAQLFQGVMPTREGDIEEFLACAADIEDWINQH